MLNKNIIQISAGGDFSLFLTEDNKAYATGHNNYGQLGIGNTNDKHKPTEINTSNISNKKIIQISAGKDFALFLTEDKKLYATGHNNYGQLGIGNTDDKTTPVEVDISNLNSDIDKIVATGEHFIVLTKNGNVYTTGRNDKWQLGIGNNKTQTLLTKVKFAFKNKNDKILENLKKVK